MSRWVSARRPPATRAVILRMELRDRVAADRKETGEGGEGTRRRALGRVKKPCAFVRREHAFEHIVEKGRVERAARREARWEPGAWFEIHEAGGARARYAGKRVAGNRVVEVLRQGPTCDTVRTVSGAVKLINRAREAEAEGAEGADA